jgi:hypothetical protein
MEKQYIKNEVKIQLWRLGKKVRDMEIFPGVKYDLLVEGKIKVGIDPAKPGCDVTAKMENGKIRYKKRGEDEWRKPTEIFGPKG